MDIIAELREITAAFDNRGIDYALCGGLAMAVYAMPRATLDIDLLIQTDSLDSARLAVEPLGFTLGNPLMIFHGGKIKILRLCKIDPQTHEALVLDLLMVTEETASAWENRMAVDWEGGKLKVVSPEGLILLKSFRRSGTDQDDIEYLKGLSDEN